jgi:hypothetical protein
MSCKCRGFRLQRQTTPPVSINTPLLKSFPQHPFGYKILVLKTGKKVKNDLKTSKFIKIFPQSTTPL